MNAFVFPIIAKNSAFGAVRNGYQLPLGMYVYIYHKNSSLPFTHKINFLETGKSYVRRSWVLVEMSVCV